jgi:excisionase family DNA binding protein
MQVHDSDSQAPQVIAYSPKGAAHASSLSLREVMKAIRAGKLASFKKGRRRIILRQDLEAYLKS